MPKRPLDAEVLKAQREAQEAMAIAKAAEAKLQALMRARDELFAALEEEHRLTGAHSDSTILPMQQESAQSLGVRIAAGRGHQSKSRKAQIAAGLTDADVAKLTDYNRSTVCKWHAGSMKVPETARKLLAKHGIPETSWSKR